MAQSKKFDEIYVQFAQLYSDFSEYTGQFKDLDAAEKHLSILFATKYLADRITAETDRLIEALAKRTK
jgi:hypothetical protein